VLYREKNLPFKLSDLERLREGNVETLLISAGDELAYVRYVEKNLGEILSDETLDVDQKCEVLYATSRGLMREVMSDPRAGDAISRSKNLVENTYGFLHGERSAFAHLLKVTSLDYYTYTHSVNVFVFSLALAEQAADTTPDVLKAFGLGALLHDVGKSLLDSSIINSSGKLSDDDWEEMKNHPQLGLKLLTEQGEHSAIVLDVVLHHHEKMCGGGYPDDLRGDQISVFSRICKIADIFDALTTRRSYKEALRTFPALRMMQTEMKEDLDPDLFRAFVGLMGNADE
jgi:putative nucleotidyltransferase with HDIG domain